MYFILLDYWIPVIHIFLLSDYIQFHWCFPGVSPVTLKSFGSAGDTYNSVKYNIITNERSLAQLGQLGEAAWGKKLGVPINKS